ncbi:MAG: PQQ-binding-like beta-propeller repeat protein [Anaerolineae bacterium]|nr:PQQ-binding-like beta-propeller repeat protein [Anaerolineae bacterium]
MRAYASQHQGKIILGLVVLAIVGYLGFRWLQEPERLLYGLDATTGQIRWVSALPAVRRPLAPAAANQRVFTAYITTVGNETSNDFTALEVHVAAFDGESGKLLWDVTPDLNSMGQVDSDSWRGSALTALGDGVYLVLNTRNKGQDRRVSHVIAYDAANGTQRWTLDNLLTDRFMPLPLKLTGGRVFAVVSPDSGAQLLSLDPISGKAEQIGAWDRYSSNSLNRPILVANSRTAYFYLSIGGENTKSQIIAYDGATGKQVFAIDTGYSPSLGCDETNLYTITQSSIVSAFNGQTGALVWTNTSFTGSGRQFNYLSGLGGSTDGALVMAKSEGDRGRSEEAWLILLDAQTGQPRWSRPYTNLLGSMFYLPMTSAGSILALGGDEGRGGVLALAQDSGQERWHLLTYGTDTQNRFSSPQTLTPTADANRVFAISYATRLSSAILRIKPEWHSREAP